MTDIGLLSIENIQYLVEQGVLNAEGNILYKKINNSGFRRPLQIWNLYCLICDDISEYLNIRDTNSIVDVMRTGSLSTDRQYPKVYSIVEKGSQLAIQLLQRNGRRENTSFEF